MCKRAGFLLLAARSLCAQAALVQGVVVNSVTHQPIAGVTVELTVIHSKEAAYRAVSDASGSFRFDSVAPDEYVAEYEKDRYESPNHTESDRPFHATAGGAVTLRVEMVPLAEIRGRVLDADGRPVAHITVDWLPSSPRRSSGGVNTDAEGRFRVEDLRPDSYVLRADPNHPAIPEHVVSIEELQRPALEAALSRRPLRAPVYYPNSTDRLGAATIQVRGGEDLAGFEIRLQAAHMYRVRGVVRDQQGRAAANASVKLRSADASFYSNDFPPDAMVVSGADGAFEFPTVGPGDWQITAEAHGDGNLFGYAAVTVTRHDLDALDLRMDAPFALNGRVEFVDGKGAAGLKDIRVVAVPVERPVWQEAMGRSAEGGALRIGHIYPGSYRITSFNRIPGYYLDSVWLGEGEVLGQPVILGPGSPPVRLVYRTDGGGVRGQVENGKGATVVLLPRNPALLDTAFIRSTTCDGSGYFAIDTLRPGSYYVLAFDRVDLDQFWNPLFVSGLTARAKGVQVERGERESLDLRLNPWPE
jgi:protocatechuate 3,4-dioxygenase beta subunit